MYRLFALLFFCPLFGKELLLIPNFTATDEMFRFDERTDYNSLNPWQKLGLVLSKYDYKISVISSESLPNKTSKIKKLLKKRDAKILMVDFNWNFFYKKLRHIPKKYAMLVIFEPPSVFTELHTNQCYKSFSKVFTWDDARVNNHTIFKFNYFDMLPMIEETVPFEERKFCCLFGGDKRSDYPYELYSERRSAIRFFEEHHPDQFDLFGSPSWKDYSFSTYKGTVDKKIPTLKGYKFAICYENTRNIQGYITEKIFDCFAAGVIPIYWGADNITDYVPASCFIDKRNFPSYEALYEFLTNIREDTFNTYLENIKNYLESEKAKAFTVNAFVLSLANGILGTHLNESDLAALCKL